jgi:tetratricopeptide (TPR) repeat protein
MRPIVAILVAAACLGPTAARAQDSYAAILLQYLSGDADAAIARLTTLDSNEIEAGVDAFDATRSLLVLTGAAAMHTEVAIRRGGGLRSTFHLDMATAIVEFGEPSQLKSNAHKQIHPQFAVPVSDDFRRLWYCTVINGLEGAAQRQLADRYLDHALALFPRNPEVRLLAGVAAEMRASPRTSFGTPGDRRRALDQAEQHYRLAVTAEPDRLEVRLRLGHVLQERDKEQDARTLLTPLTTSSDARIAYLASLFLGGIEDQARHADAALALYDRASALLPSAQTAHLAASELRHRGGDHQAAADAIPRAAGADNAFDPWWTYAFGEYWRVDMLLGALRGLRKA